MTPARAVARAFPACVVVLCCTLATATTAGEPSERLKVPGFGTVSLYAPAAEPKQVVLFMSGDGGWNLGVVSMAERLRDLGALVAGVDIRAFLASIEAARGCAYPAGALEGLSRRVQLQRRLAAYRRPILVGYSSGATLVYAALAAAPAETFAGAISLGFCSELDIRKPPCPLRGLAATQRPNHLGYELAPFPGLAVPWMVLQGEIDQVCAPTATRAFVGAIGRARLFSLPNVGHGFSVPRNWDAQFVEAYQGITAAQPPEPPLGRAPGIEDLALAEVAADGGRPGEFAVVLTGDGGWAEIDKAMAAGLSRAGIPVVGWSSLRYYWTPRTPETAAADLARILDHYAAAWQRPQVRLIGYSFGADVLPFLVNRLPPQSRARVTGVTLLGPSADASFEFHVSSWLGGGGGPRHPTLPEIERLPVPVTCVRAEDDAASPCSSLRGPETTVGVVGRGHHFSGDYARLVELIIGPSAR